ncbi:hypothetical protein GCK72_020036 [Caenorhabditis remanei]|uniref:Ground-like domain-containing protein n=1 Tax=Caenorhabditis remanei TaxID=31234 RepID=A0A6A5GGD9_CAERE|nr:hypothetical protein GCK72_020036 [Caenorhabditis remanei]KAF1753479.1 hypothetical protein GCK72_020036 [Caenorhabditis remanei]
MQSSILILLALVSIAAACPGLFGMMGGGGGGCGCRPPPPPSSCGCGGRKKRSLPDKPAAPEFFGIAASDEDELCNNSDLKKIILENMQSSPTDSSKAINGALEVKELSRFTVVCSENSFVFTIRADTAYCGAQKNGHTCKVFSM